MLRLTLPMLLLTSALPLCGQTPVSRPDSTASAATPLAFDVVSIKLDPSGSEQANMKMLPDGIQLLNITPAVVIREGYLLLYNEQLPNVPQWATSERYDIVAKVSGSDVLRFHQLTFDQVREMLQPILASRFALRVHRETKQLPVYDLTVSRGGPKFQESQPDEIHPNGLLKSSSQSISMQGLPIGSLVFALTRQLGREVIDQTRLTGKYNLELHWTNDDPTPQRPDPESTDSQASQPTGADSPSIFTALQEQLGLKLVSTKGPVPILVIDHIEKPSEN